MSKSATIYLGLFLMAIGLQLRAVESFVLRPEATRLRAGVAGPGADTPGGMARQFALENTSMKKVLTPPAWLGWALLSGGFVAIIYANRQLH